jgi:hypothetical protein
VNRLSDPKTSRAVLIGAYEYQDQELENLPAVQRNLQRLRELLTDPLLWGLPEAHCRVLERPARETVLDTVMRAGTEATDTLLVYYAGHGLVNHLSDELHLALPSTHRDRLYTALRYADLRDTLRAGNICASRKVVILDCCWSGLALHGPMSADSLGQRATIDGTYVLTASAETRPSLAPPGETYTAFSGELINVLDRGIPDGPGLLAMSDLYGHIRQALIAKGRPEPQQRFHNVSGATCLARNRAVADPTYSPEPTDERPSQRLRQHRPYRRVLLALAAGTALAAVALPAIRHYAGSEGWPASPRPSRTPDRDIAVVAAEPNMRNMAGPCALSSGAEVCFQPWGDQIWVRDLRADHATAVARWSTDYGRSGICVGKGFRRWAACNKDFKEAHVITWCAAQRNLSTETDVEPHSEPRRSSVSAPTPAQPLG